MKPFVTGELTITRPGGDVEVVTMEEWRRRHPVDGSWSKGRDEEKAPVRYGRGRFVVGWKRRDPDKA